jgi:nitroreductase
MNETLAVIERRRSTRVYSSQPITDSEKDAILQATLRAPTAGNLMLYSIIEVEDQSLKDHLAETCDHQPFIARAPYVLLFLADFQRWFDYYTLSGVEARCKELGLPYRTPQVGDLLLACCDALIAAQTAVLAAESLGIGSCYIGDILENSEIHRQLFNLPPYALPITLLCFGHPFHPPTAESHISRFERRFIVSKNAYHRLSPQDFSEMFQELEAKDLLHHQPVEGANNLGQHVYFRKFAADFTLEMNRSVQEMIKNWL